MATESIPAVSSLARAHFLMARAVIPVAMAVLLLTSPTFAQGVLADKPAVQAALNRFAGGHSYASDADRLKDQALLFANNESINRARLNNEIPDTVYQTAQRDFATLNKRFTQEALPSGVTFVEQTPSGKAQGGVKTFSPGTDSDYILMVENKEQILQTQRNYNQRVNEFLERSGVPEQRVNWHNKLDTDFMADPSKIRDPAEFREIAKYNNDAYKRQMAAQYEEISRANDGRKIGPRHVEGYVDEMSDFVGKKGNKIDDLLAKGPSYFSDPAHRAELFQAMAQEQKYVSRVESLDDFLRAQEGLPPRDRSGSIARLGADRSPHNAGNIRRAHAVTETSRLSAMEDLAETMGQVARKNPAFSSSAADDIARIVEQLPADRRAGVLARIRANGSPGLVDDIVAVSARAGRLPAGSSLADDIARAGSKFDDMVDAVTKMDDLADAGRGTGALGKAIGALEAIGKVADAAEVVIAAAQLADLFRQIKRAADPALPPEERNDLLERIRLAANELRDSAALGAIMQRHPAVAIIYGAWTVGCLAGELRSASTEASGDCLDRQMTAWDRAAEDIHSWWTGDPTEREAHARALCDKFTAAVKAQRIRMKPDWKVVDACNWIRYGMPVDHMVERVPVTPNEIAPKPGQTVAPQPPASPSASVPPANDPELIARLDKAMAELDAARERYEQRIGQEAPDCQRAAEAMMPDGPNSIAGRTRRIEQEKARFLTRLWPDRDRHQDAYNNVRSMTDALKRVVGQTVAAADLACARLSGAAASLAAGKDSVLRTRNLGVLADGIGAQALADADKLIEQLNDSRYESGSDRRAMISSIYSAADNFRSFCSGLPRPNNAVMDGDIPRVEETAITLVRMAESDSSGVSAELAATYRGRYQNHIRERNAIGRRSMCGTDRQAAIDACHRSMSRIADMIPEAAEKFDEVVTARTGAVERVKTDQDDIASLVKQRRDAEALARQCLTDAENNQPPRSGGGKVVLLPPVPPPVTVMPPPPGPGPLPGPTGPLGPTGPTTGPTPGPTTGPAPGPTGPTTGPAPVTGPSPGASPGPTQDRTRAGADCDPNKVPPPKPDTSPGFVPVPYKGATAWTGATNPDCSPYGPAAKRSDDGLAVPETEVPAPAQPAGCRLAANHYQTARSSYESGDASAYKTGLIKAEQAMAALPAAACGELSQKIARGHEQAEVLKKINGTAGELLSSCRGSDPRTRAAQMRELSGLLGKTNHPYVQQLVRRLDAAQNAALTYAGVKDAFDSGDLDTSWRRLEVSRNALGALEKGDCADLRAAVDKAPQVLSHWRGQVDAVERATRACAVDDMEREQRRLGATDSPMARGLATQLGAALPDCRRKQVREREIARQHDEAENRRSESGQPAAPDDNCRNKFGAGYRAGGDAPNNEHYCIPDQAAANARCVQLNSAGFYAANIRSDGSFDCMPTKERANANCQAANPGRRGVYGDIGADGSVQCKQTNKAAQQEAKAAGDAGCRQANRNRRARAGRYLGNGQWSCYIPGQNRTVTHRQPSVSAQDVARGLATMGAIINLMQSRGGGGGGGGGHRH